MTTAVQTVVDVGTWGHARQRLNLVEHVEESTPLVSHRDRWPII